MEQQQADKVKLEQANRYFTNELRRAGIVVQDGGYSLPGYGDDWASTLWIEPGPKGFTAWVRLYRRGEHRGLLQVSDYSEPWQIEDLETVGPSIVAKIKQTLTTGALPS